VLGVNDKQTLHSFVSSLSIGLKKIHTLASRKIRKATNQEQKNGKQKGSLIHLERKREILLFDHSAKQKK